MKIIKGSIFKALIRNLKYMTTFRCEHGEPNCFNTPRGACCNSCWARDFAEHWLKKWGQL